MMEERDERWRAKQAHYQDPRVVREYDAARFQGAHQRGSTRRKWSAIQRALGRDLDGVRRVLDVPCGTGRFTRLLLTAGKQVVNADLSAPMLAAAREVAAGHAHGEVTPNRVQVALDSPSKRSEQHERGPQHESRVPTAHGALAASVRADALRLPFADASFDLVLSIRFLLHVPRELRPTILREYARVSRRFVVVDVRHKYCFTTWSKRVRAKIARRRAPSPRYSLAEIDEDLAASGLVLRRRVWLAQLFSEKMLLVCDTGLR